MPSVNCRVHLVAAAAGRGAQHGVAAEAQLGQRGQAAQRLHVAPALQRIVAQRQRLQPGKAGRATCGRPRGLGARRTDAAGVGVCETLSTSVELCLVHSDKRIEAGIVGIHVKQLTAAAPLHHRRVTTGTMRNRPGRMPKSDMRTAHAIAHQAGGRAGRRGRGGCRPAAGASARAAAPGAPPPPSPPAHSAPGPAPVCGRPVSGRRGSEKWFVQAKCRFPSVTCGHFTWLTLPDLPTIATQLKLMVPAVLPAVSLATAQINHANVGTLAGLRHARGEGHVHAARWGQGCCAQHQRPASPMARPTRQPELPMTTAP